MRHDPMKIEMPISWAYYLKKCIIKIKTYNLKKKFNMMLVLTKNHFLVYDESDFMFFIAQKLSLWNYAVA